MLRLPGSSNTHLNERNRRPIRKMEQKATAELRRDGRSQGWSGVQQALPDTGGSLVGLWRQTDVYSFYRVFPGRSYGSHHLGGLAKRWLG